MKLSNITVCVDMSGCPNRCKHCWLGGTLNQLMDRQELEHIAKDFKPFAESLEILSWYREPDYRNDYKELWEIEKKLSDYKTPHFELVSFWRLVRDKTYVNWLSSLGVRTCQLTLFGTQATTDYYVGRKGAYLEIIESIEILLDHKIAPRLQIFVNKMNIDELDFIEALIVELGLEQRCQDIGQNFQVFIHQGSPDGENVQFYDSWICESDLHKIPDYLAQKSIQYFQKNNIKDVFGESEEDLYKQLQLDTQGVSLIRETPTFYLDANFDVFPNIAGPEPWWRLGNYKKDGASKIIENYVSGNFYGNQYMLVQTVSDLVKKHGNPSSQRLFTKSDYIFYLINIGCKAC